MSKTFNYADLIAKVNQNSQFLNVKDEKNPQHLITSWVNSSADNLFNAELIEESGKKTVSFYAPSALTTRLNNIDKLGMSIGLQTQDIVIAINYQGIKKSNKNRDVHSYFVQILAPDTLVELAKKEAEEKKSNSVKNVENGLSVAEMIVKMNELGLSNDEISQLVEKEITALHGLIDKESAILIVHKKAITTSIDELKATIPKKSAVKK